jgi:ribonuclease-3
VNPPLDRLLRQLDYRFSDPGLLDDALTHRSVGSRNNERLEFLGDAVLSFVIAAELYRRFPDADEGTLSRLRATLVKGETLAKLARELELGEYLHLGSGELKSGGFRRDSILADALEAVMGAVYLDGGIDEASRLVHALYANRLEKATPRANLKDPKTRLQEYLQGRKLDLPEYEVVSLEGEAHAQTFTVICRIADLDIETRGTGGSRRKAEQAAAQVALERIGHD